jgi:two-component system, LuxR family, sensor kinase FixL
LVATHLYRIAQEAINNALRHGKATKLRVRLADQNGRITLTVRDNGVGFHPELKHKTGLGLQLMHYRARTIGASLEVVSHRTCGTVVTCRMRSALEKDTAARL